MQGLIPLLVTFGLMWALLIRPQQRRARMHREVVATLEPGDEIITSGGICGTILSIDEDVLLVEVATGVSIRVLRAAVQQRVGPVEEVLEEEGSDIDDAGIDHTSGGPNGNGAGEGRA